MHYVKTISVQPSCVCECVVYGNFCFFHPSTHETIMTLLRITKFYSFRGPDIISPFFLNF